MRRTSFLLASTLCVGLTTRALAQVPESARTLVTDPAVLASMGFPPDSKNVYVGNAIGRVVQTPEDWGLAAHYTSIPAKSFIGRNNNPGSEWEYNGGAMDCCLNLSRTGAEQFADSPISLPTGASITAIRFWGFDNHAGQDMGFFLFETCLPSDGPGAPTFTQIASASTSAAVGYQSDLLTGALPLTVNNRDCSYIARVRFGDTIMLTFHKLRIEWHRQVTPAPAVATFTDVPTTHPFFRFVEALAASGITGGCGAGIYCPDNPLTRGQMAVFLSVALGLYFP